MLSFIDVTLAFNCDIPKCTKAAKFLIWVHCTLIGRVFTEAKNLRITRVTFAFNEVDTISQSAKIHVSDKLRLIIASRTRKDFMSIGDILRIKTSTARNIFSRAMKQQYLRGARNRRVDDEKSAFFEDTLRSDPTNTL